MTRSASAAALSAALSTALWAALWAAAPASAHHGINAFDHNQDVHLEGTIVRLDFVNPHSWLYIDVTDSSGTVVHHRCELRAATVLRRSGWTPEMFPMGEPIVVDASPHRSDPNSCYLNTATFADGSSVDRYGQIYAAADASRTLEEVVAAHEPRTRDGEPNIYGDWAPEQVVMTDPRGKAGALVPLSTADDFAPGELPEGATPLTGSRGTDPSQTPPATATGPWATRNVEPTEAGRLAAEGFETYSPEDNPRMRCETTSVIFDWTFDGPINRISRGEDKITIQYGQYGFTRTIFLNESAHPDDLEPSRAGHSIGRWEDDVLVVDTVGFAPGVLSPPILNSDQLHIVERYALNPETKALTRSYTATDPVYFVGEYTGSDTILPSVLPFAPDPCDDTTLLDFSQAGAEGGGN